MLQIQKGHSMHRSRSLQHPYRNGDALHNIHHMLIYHKLKMPTKAKYRQKAETETG